VNDQARQETMNPSFRIGAARIGALGFLAVALGCAALAAFAFGRVLESRYSGDRVVPIVIAAAPISAGQLLRAELLATRDWPADAVPAGAYASVEEILTGHPGASPMVGILAGEPVVAARLSSSAAGTGIAPLVARGKRAIALRIDDAAGETGLVYPGAVVDVVTTVRDPLGRGPSARIAVQRARVLSVGRDTDVATQRAPVAVDEGDLRSRDRATFVTLEVTPGEAEVLAVARNEGRLDVVLRNAGDDEPTDTRGATPDHFSAFAEASGHGDARPGPPRRGRRSEPAPASTSPSRTSIEVYHAR
jgi:pilus assembly protein CpaB